MSYVKQTLAPGEEILLRANFNWTYSFWAVFWAVVGTLPIVYLAGLHLVTGSVPGNPGWLYGFSGAPAAVGLLMLMAHLVHLNTTEIAVTTNRFVFKTGLISRETKEVSLNKIEEINLTQSILGRIFGYGHLVLRGTGVGVIELPDIDNPVQIRRTIEGAKARLRQAPEDRDNYADEPEPVRAPAAQATPASRLMRRAKGPKPA